jgi:hypothetical protein
MRSVLFLLVMFGAATAAADQPTSALPTTIPDTTVPTLSCVQPELPDMAKVSSKELKSVQTRIKAYGDCVQQYIDDRHAKSAIYINLQKAEVDAGNAAVKIINDFFAQVRELQDKQRAPPAKSAN